MRRDKKVYTNQTFYGRMSIVKFMNYAELSGNKCPNVDGIYLQTSFGKMSFCNFVINAERSTNEPISPGAVYVQGSVWWNKQRQFQEWCRA